MTFEEWVKLAVSTSDLRTLMIEGLQDSEEPVPGVAFMKPTFDGSASLVGFDNLGFILQDRNTGTWDVLIENTEKEFKFFSDAARYLWDEHYEDILSVTPFLLIMVDRDGHIILNRRCVSEDHMLEMAANMLPDGDSAMKEALDRDLSTIGARFHEFVGGHFAAFPLYN